jgi:hypothetical protein
MAVGGAMQQIEITERETPVFGGAQGARGPEPREDRAVLGSIHLRQAGGAPESLVLETPSSDLGNRPHS